MGDYEKTPSHTEKQSGCGCSNTSEAYRDGTKDFLDAQVPTVQLRTDAFGSRANEVGGKGAPEDVDGVFGRSAR